MKSTKRIYTAPFEELPQEVQADIIEGKLRDIIRYGLIPELAQDILEGNNSLLEQARQEFYTLDGNYVDEI